MEETVTESIGRYWGIDGIWWVLGVELLIAVCSWLQLHGAKLCKAMQGSDLLDRRLSDAGIPTRCSSCGVWANRYGRVISCDYTMLEIGTWMIGMYWNICWNLLGHNANNLNMYKHNWKHVHQCHEHTTNPLNLTIWLTFPFGRHLNTTRSNLYSGHLRSSLV